MQNYCLIHVSLDEHKAVLHVMISELNKRREREKGLLGAEGRQAGRQDEA